MSKPGMRWAIGAAAGIVAVAGLGRWIGIGRLRAQDSAATKPVAAGLSEVEKAILAIDEAYVLAYNKGDAKAVAAMFAEDADVVEADGARYRGRPAIEARFAEIFAASPGVRVAIETDEIRPLSAEVVKESGRALVSPKSGAAEESAFTVLYVKKGGAWTISDVREETVPPARPGDRLKELEGLIGDWVEERPDATVRLHCDWSEDKNFLMRTVSVLTRGKADLTISQRIGWDPAAEQVRSWEFDSSGSFGEGRWSREGDRWVIKHTGTLPDGTASSATNIMTIERPDQIRWVSTDRVFGDHAVDDLEANILVRVPPAPGSKPAAPAPPSPKPITGSPR